MTVDAQFDAHEQAPVSTREARKTGGAASTRRVRRQRDRSERWSRVLLVAALVCSAMGLGGLHWAALALSALAALAGGYLALRGVPGRGAYAPALIPVALAVCTLLQLVPLPMALLRGLSPAMAEMWAGALRPLGEAPLAWAPLTADPNATILEALKWLGYGGAMTAAIAVGARRGARFVAMALFGCAVLVAVTTMVHGLAGLQRVYGIYIPTFNVTRWHVGPFMNPNNLAGYLNLGMLSGVGLILSRRPGLPRVVLATGVASLLAAVVLSASRAGLAAMVIGLFVFGVLALYAQRRESIGERLSPRAVLLTVGSVVVFAALLAWLGSSRETWVTLLDKNVEKVEVMQRVAPLIADHPWFGVGRGAFETVFPAYHFGAANVIYAHAENFAVQWVAEWGVPVGVAALLALGWMFVGALRSATSSLTGAGVWAGLFALSSQNLLDLGLELPGIAMAAATGLGALHGHPRKEKLEASLRRRDLPMRAVGWVAVGGGLVLAVLVVLGSRSSATKDRIQVHDLVAKTQYRNPEHRAATRARVREAMLEHPADPYFPRAGALLAWYGGENPMPWIARSLERGMQIGQTHFTLAKILKSRGAKNQALMEIRLATTYSPALGPAAGRVVSAMTRDYEDILRATPEGAPGAMMLLTVAQNLRRNEAPWLRLQLFAEAVERYPEGVFARTVFADDLAAAIASPHPESPCAADRRAMCEQLVMDQVEAMEKLEPQSPAGIMARSLYLMSVGRSAEAEALLRKGCQRFSYESFSLCQKRRVVAAAAMRSREALDRASQDLAAAGCNTGPACGQLYTFLGGQAESLGDHHRALTYHRRALAEDPVDARYAAVVRVANLVGDQGLATATLKQMDRLRPGNKDVQKQLDEQRRRALLNGLAP